MLLSPNTSDDDPDFLAIAERAIRGWTTLTSARLLHLVKVDTWFGDKWYTFAGKLGGGGGVGIHTWLNVPPFHPNRVVSERRFEMTDPPRLVSPPPEPLHIRQHNDANLRNPIAGHGDSMAFAWCSGKTKANGRGALMAYASTGMGPLGWYAGFVRKASGWRVIKLLGSDERQWSTMLELGEALYRGGNGQDSIQQAPALTIKNTAGL